MTRTNGNVRFASHGMAEMHGFALGRTTRTNAGQLPLSGSAKRRSNPDGQDNCLLEHCPSPVDDAPAYFQNTKKLRTMRMFSIHTKPSQGYFLSMSARAASRDSFVVDITAMASITKTNNAMCISISNSPAFGIEAFHYPSSKSRQSRIGSFPATPSCGDVEPRFISLRKCLSGGSADEA